MLTGALSCILLVCCSGALALDPSLDISQYAHTAWKIRDGFAKGIILPIAQTPDGYLWLGTEFGLLRFDGVRTVPFQLPAGEHLASENIRDLMVSRDGTLWIATMKGLASWKDGRLTQYRESAGLVIGSLYEDREETVWFAVHELSRGRLCVVRHGRVDCYGEGILGNSVIALYEDHAHNLWASATTGLWRWAPGPPVKYAFPRGVTEANAITEDDAGTLLLATNDGLKRLAAGKIETYTLPGVTGQFRPNGFLRSSDDGLWIGSTQGLLHWHQGRVDRFGAADGLSGDFVTRIFEDREANVWVSTSDGLDRFREYGIPTISRNQGLPTSYAYSVQAASDGSVWVGTTDGLSRWANGSMSVYRDRSALTDSRPIDENNLNVRGAPAQSTNSGLAGTPRTLGLGDSGQLWVSTSSAVFYFDGSRFIRVAGVPGGKIWSIAGSGHGSVWILHQTAGIFLWSPTAAVQQIPLSQLPQKTAATMLPDQAPDSLWLGFFEGGVVYLQNGKVVHSYGPADGLGDGRVMQLRWGSLGAVMAATEGGLSRINIKDRHVATLSSKNGLPCDKVHWSMEDNDHNVWVYMPCGLARIERAEWEAWVGDPGRVIKTTLFDNSDGVRTVALYGGYGPNVTKSPDGRIWFVPRDGVSVIDPRHLLMNKLPPPVHVEQLTADGKSYDPANGLQLPPHVRDLAIDYTALSLVAPEKIHFRYKLEGQDPDWKEVINDRRAQYSNLPPRHYTFRVMACNNSGVWNEAGAALEFSVLPAFYQTNGFRVFCVAAFLALLWSIYQLRLQQLQRQFNIGLDARVNERTRIARELHDTLLQNFHGLMFQFQAARNLMSRHPDEAIRSLDDAIGETKRALAESREAIQDLRSEPIAKGNLAELLTDASRDLAESNANGKAPDFDLIEEGNRQALSSSITSEISRIALELMRNAYQHAQAKRVEAEIRYGETTLRLRIRDDGKGIDPKVLKEGGKAGHWGLRGVRERADRIGARLDLWSEPGNGTEAELLVPASLAYEGYRESYRAKLLRKVRPRA